MWGRPVLSALALIVVLGTAAVWRWTSTSTSPLPQKPSIAVLPFQNFGGDTRWNLLADGMTEDVITDLAHSKDLFVIARNSTDAYKGKPTDVRNVGRDLGV